MSLLSSLMAAGTEANECWILLASISSDGDVNTISMGLGMPAILLAASGTSCQEASHQR